MNMNILELHNIGKKYNGSPDWAVKDFHLSVSAGEIVALLGESGCGKTTILRMIAGFEKPTAGTICIDGEVVVDEKTFVAPQQRKVGIVFQDYALFPHKTVQENILFGLSGISRKLASEKAASIIALSGLEGLEKRFPHQLSGGQKQRVALARALAPEPRIILFDEPFSNLDSMRKAHMRDEISQIIRNTGATAIFVTHDTKDVMTIADKVSVIRNGKSMQTGSPDEIYNFPGNIYVADFFGKTNIFPARILKDGLSTPIGIIKMDKIIPLGAEVMVSIRPEQFQLVDNHPDSIRGKIIRERFMGEYTELTCEVQTDSGDKIHIMINTQNYFKCPEKECCFIANENRVCIIHQSIP
jgi:iron(III) transport system ATP-binding protein